MRQPDTTEALAEAGLPADLPALAEAGDAEAPARWWTSLEDPVLDALIEESLAGSFTLRAALARLEEARADRAASRAEAWPELSAYARSSVGTDDPFVGTRRVPLEVGLSADWEVDLWGRVRAQTLAETARVEASRADLHAAALSLSAEVAGAAWALQASRERQALLASQLEANEGLQDLSEARFDRGQLGWAEVLQQQRLAEATRADLAAEAARGERLEHALAVLLGRLPQGEGAVFSELPALRPPPPLPATGLPLALLERRPDVQAAWLRVHAANADLAASIRDRFPSLRLGGSVSNAPDSLATALEGWVASLSASLVAPLFDGGGRRAAVRGSRAVLEQRVAEYGSAVLLAFQEVEDALTRERELAQRVASLEAQARLATESAEGLEARFLRGQASQLEVLQATTTAQALERQLVDARLEALTVRAGLHRALAGELDGLPGLDGTGGADPASSGETP